MSTLHLYEHQPKTICRSLVVEHLQILSNKIIDSINVTVIYHDIHNFKYSQNN